MQKNIVVRKQSNRQSDLLNILGTQIQFLCSASDTNKGWSLMEAVLPKHSGPPPHCHPWDEAYYVIEGEVRFVIADQEHVVGRGDFIYAPGGTVHSFEGISESHAKMLIFDAPAHSEAFFRVIDREVRDLPQDLNKMPLIGEQHQVQFMTP